jgi:cytochrome c556
MNRLAFVKTLTIGLLTLAISASVSGDDQGEKKKKASVWMKAKTEYTQNILVGLTEGDFEKIENNAKALGVTDFLEYWFRAKQLNYRKQMMFFDHANQEVIRHAKAKNLAGVTLAFNQLTASCVECHQIVRDAKK